MDYLADIVLGTKSPKCTIHELDGNIVSISNRQPEGSNPYPDHPEWMTWNTEKIWGRLMSE
jgi:sugar (pentulose or hexulose) kinase